MFSQLQRCTPVQFSELELGDYFRDETNQKFRKVPQFEINVPGITPGQFNAFHIQGHAHIRVQPDERVIFIRHSAWDETQNYGFSMSIEEAELDHRIEFFRENLHTLDSLLDQAYVDPPDTNGLDGQQTDEFTNLLYSSFFVSLYSFLEVQLNRV